MRKTFNKIRLIFFERHWGWEDRWEIRIPKFIRKIGYVFTDIIDFFRYSLPCGIENLKYWFPIIWNDRHWDQNFLYFVLKHKLEAIREHFAVANTSDYSFAYVGIEEDIKKINACITFLDWIINGKIEEEEYKRLEDKWGKLYMCFEPSYNEKTGDYGNSSLCIIERRNANTPEEKEQSDEDRRKANERIQRKENAIQHGLFTLLKNNNRKWWI